MSPFARWSRRSPYILLVAALSLLAGTTDSPALPTDKPRMTNAKYKVKTVRNVVIPTRDGTKLAADLIRPDADGKFPAIIEYIPYRKDDITLSINDAHHYFAERGFVGVRL